MSVNVGIHGIGTYLPDEVRTNAWWPPEVVEAWRPPRTRDTPEKSDPPLTPGQLFALKAVCEAATDPFRGARERRILAEHLESSDMEVAAARSLFERVDLEPRDIDLLLTYSSASGYQTSNNACTVHAQLGLTDRCFSLQVEAACNSFQHQLILANAMIRAGQARWALLLQSNLLTRLCPPEQPHSAWFGDGATAVLVGPVADERGLLGWSQYTDGSLQNMLVATTAGGRWWEDGAIQLLQVDREKGKRLLLGLPDTSRMCIHAALEQAGVSPGDVRFFASHQGTCWLRKVVQEHAGLQHARTVDLFSRFGSLSAANIPLSLFEAERDGLLAPGDIVVTYGGGSGVTFGSTVLRWGV